MVVFFFYIWLKSYCDFKGQVIEVWSYLVAYSLDVGMVCVIEMCMCWSFCKRKGVYSLL